MITTFLEMRERPQLTVSRPIRAGMLLRLEEPTLHFYRYLYETIGSRWHWAAHQAVPDDDLRVRLDDPLYEVFVLFMGGSPAGMFELDRRLSGEIELTHFGLVPDFIGRGLGKYLLAAAVEAAWDHDPERVWARVSDLDHPRALMTYQWAGFEVYDSRTDG